MLAQPHARARELLQARRLPAEAVERSGRAQASLGMGASIRYKLSHLQATIAPGLANVLCLVMMLGVCEAEEPGLACRKHQAQLLVARAVLDVLAPPPGQWW